MANVSQIEHIAPASRVHAAILGATLTVLALVGGLMGGLIGGSFTFHGLIGKASNPLTYTLAAIVFGTGILSGSALWGVSMALHEEGLVDTRTGAFVNRDLAGYLVPVNADIPEIDAVILQSFDDKANELGAKGVGEVGNCGANAAVANAVFNATGVRVRDFPITIEKVLPGLPPQE